jgi:plastocyanin
MTKNATRRTLFATSAIAACLLAAGCSSSKTAANNPATGSASSSSSTPSGAASTPTGAVAATTITIKNFGYAVSGSATAGSQVKVTNNDAEAHTVTADSGKAFDVTIQPGKTAKFAAPATAGSYKFHCSFHSNMHGTLTVSQ